jgi:hypothetical protein
MPKQKFPAIQCKATLINKKHCATVYICGLCEAQIYKKVLIPKVSHEKAVSAGSPIHLKNNLALHTCMYITNFCFEGKSSVLFCEKWIGYRDCANSVRLDCQGTETNSVQQ